MKYFRKKLAAGHHRAYYSPNAKIATGGFPE
jgi:hypothetical protein